jgi:hypothetical protein
MGFNLKCKNYFLINLSSHINLDFSKIFTIQLYNVDNLSNYFQYFNFKHNERFKI